MATGWEKAPDGKWYYFEGSGAMRSGGWMKQGSSWYYLSGSGAMQTGWAEQGRLLVLARPREREDGHRAGRRPPTASGTTSKAPAPYAPAAG